LTFQNHTDCPLTDFGGKTSIFSHPVYLFLRKFSLQDSRGGSAFSQLYGYTSDQGGICHALTEEDVNPTLAEAKFMLVTCSAFSNYLLSKISD
ncbi:hypothetical protein NEM79_21265, partial [Escherichia coli]|nr:hypothetical protein [Escherichia coli]